MTPGQKTAFEQLKSGLAHGRKLLEEVPNNHYVIYWHDSALRTDGDRVGLLGSKTYSMASRVLMQREADRFQSLSKDDSPVEVLSVKEAIERHDKQAADLVSNIESQFDSK